MRSFDHLASRSPALTTTTAVSPAHCMTCIEGRVGVTSSRNRRRVHERAPRTLDLEPSLIVLKQQRDTTVVCVPPRADLVAVLREHFCAGSRVVQKSQRMVSHVRECVEEARIESHPKTYGAHDFDVEVVTGLEEVLHGGSEGGVLRPVVRVSGLVVAADLEGLFEVGVNAAEGGDERGVRELGHFFAAVRDVAAVGLGGGLGRVSWGVMQEGVFVFG